MINYDYVCKNCNHEIKDVLQSIKDEPIKKCEECGNDTLERVIYGGIGGFVENTSTIGQLADKNTKQMGSYKRSELEERAKESKKAASPQTVYGKHATATRQEINKMTPQQKTNYIMKGNK